MERTRNIFDYVVWYCWWWWWIIVDGSVHLFAISWLNLDRLTMAQMANDIRFEGFLLTFFTIQSRCDIDHRTKTQKRKPNVHSILFIHMPLIGVIVHFLYNKLLTTWFQLDGSIFLVMDLLLVFYFFIIFWFHFVLVSFI